MPSNVEIKACVSDLENLKKLAFHLSESSGTLIQQEDTFFKVPQGRLKLRKLKDQPSQLIYYERSDQAGPKFSDYHITLTEEPESLKETLRRSIGILGEVKKTRWLYIVGQTRVHVDTVEGLGDFMELEVVMKEGQCVEEGQTIANNLMKQLEIKPDQLISCAYMDLILKKKEKV